MTDHEKEVMERFVQFIEHSDKETREKLICFCEGAVGMATIIQKEEKTA